MNTSTTPTIEKRREQAAQALLQRAVDSARALADGGFPHWADARTGVWTTTPDGDWTGGSFPGSLWLGYRLTGDAAVRDLAHAWALKLTPRVERQTAFKGFGFFCGGALGSLLGGDEAAGDMAQRAAESLLKQYDPNLGLIPLGPEAEEAGDTSAAHSSIDSLQASPLLYWAARRTGDSRFRECADQHTRQVFRIHCREDGSIIQSTELDAQTGKIRRQFTHKGYSDTSIWGRAQAWGMLYAAMAHVRTGSDDLLADSMRAADWWINHVPADGVSYWDFDDPAIPDAPRDTGATTIACAALLRLAEHAPDSAARTRYREAAEQAVDRMIADYLTTADQAPAGRLLGGCFNHRADSRAHDRVSNAELVFASYFLLECLMILMGKLRVDEL